MSAQEIIKELMKLSPDELAEIDLKLHELLQRKPSTSEKSWGEALLEVAGTIEGLLAGTRKITIIICTGYRVDEGLWRRGLLHCLTERSRPMA